MHENHSYVRWKRVLGKWAFEKIRHMKMINRTFCTKGILVQKQWRISKFFHLKKNIGTIIIVAIFIEVESMY